MEYIDIVMFTTLGALIEVYTGLVYKLLVKVGLKK